MKKSVGIIIALLTLCLVLALPAFAAEETTTTIKTPGIAAASLSYDGGVHMYFYLYVGETEPAEDVEYGMIFWKAEQTSYTYESAVEAGTTVAKIVKKADATDDTYKEHFVKVFTYSVQDTGMTDIVYAQGYMKESGESGYTYSDVIPYSVQTYAGNKLGINPNAKPNTVNNDANFRRLVEALLEYGTASQCYYNYRTDDLADTILYWTDSSQLTYTDNGDGTCSVSGFGSLSDVVIPKMALSGDCKGKTVTGITDEALTAAADAGKLERVSIPVTVKSVKVEKLNACTTLKSAYIPSSAAGDGSVYKFVAQVSPGAGGTIADGESGTAITEASKIQKDLVGGSVISLTATANDNYEFDGWYNAAGTKLSAAPDYRCVVAADLTLEARFTPNITYGNETSASMELKYTGAAAVVWKNYVMVGGTAWSEITDETILSNLTYKWLYKDGSALPENATKNDITLDGSEYTFGHDERTGGVNEIVGPCTVGEYKLVVYYGEAEKLTVNVTIKEDTYKKITDFASFNSTEGVGLLQSMNYYTIVGVADGKLFVMQMPEDGSKVEAGTTVVEAEAREVTADENGIISLGSELDFVFANMTYYRGLTQYYPADSTDVENKLLDFTTGYYGARLEQPSSGTFDYWIYRTGYVSLSGGRITREKGLIPLGSGTTKSDYGHLVKFGDDGAVTIYEPRKGQTENNALRLVKDGDKYVFTSVPKDTDSRKNDSYPVYIYKRGEKAANTNTVKVEWEGNLDKPYDGNPVSFDLIEDKGFADYPYYVDGDGKVTGYVDIYEMARKGTLRFLFTDSTGKEVCTSYVNVIDGGSVDGVWKDDEMSVTGPSAVGKYTMWMQLNESTDEGKENWITAQVCTFEISAAAESAE